MTKSFKDHVKAYTENGGVGNLIPLEDLDDKDRAKVVSEIFKTSKKIGDYYKAYVMVLSKYGIMCPHPQAKRVYEGVRKSEKILDDYRWYDCEMCGCAVFNEHWMRIKDLLEDKVKENV